MQPGPGIGKSRTRLDRRSIRLDGECDRATGGLCDRIETAKVSVRAFLAEPAHGAVNDPRIDLADGFITEAEFICRAWRKILQEDIALADQPGQDFLTLAVLQIDRDASLVRIQDQEIERVGVGRIRRGNPRGIAKFRPFALKDIGAEKSERLRERRPRLPLAKVTDLDA